VIVGWLRSRADRVLRGEKIITYRDLKRILESFDYSLENPKNNSIDVVRYNALLTAF
jgi:hypothetical protein